MATPLHGATHTQTYFRALRGTATMSNEIHKSRPVTSNPNSYASEDVAQHLRPDTPAARRELAAVADLAARFVDECNTERSEGCPMPVPVPVPVPVRRSSPAYWKARKALAEVRLALEAHARNVGPRALRAVATFLQLRYRQDPNLVTPAEHLLRAELWETDEGTELIPGSAFRVPANPNPDSVRPKDVEEHGTHFAYNPEPAVNVKAPTDFRRVDFAELRAELGLNARDGRAEPVAPTGRYVDEESGAVCDEDDEGAVPEVLPFGLEWIEARWDLDSYSGHGNRSAGFYEGPESFARETAWEDGAERVRELFADFGSPELVSAGRSGGWACVKGLNLDVEDLALLGCYAEDEEEAPMLEELDALRKRAPQSSRDPNGSDLTDEEYDRLEELEEWAEYEGEEDVRERAAELERFLGAWGEFVAYCAAAVADFPRSVAWYCGNVFEREAEEYATELERVAKVRVLVADKLPALAGLRVLEDADPDELEKMLARSEQEDALRADPDVAWNDGHAEGLREAASSDALAQLGRAVLAELKERSMIRTREFHGRPLYDGLARDGFYALRKRAAELGLLDDEGRAPK